MASASPSPRPQVKRQTNTIGIAICTYKRPDALSLCLEGLAAQTRRPDEVMIIARPDDDATHELMRLRADDGLTWRIVPVERPGLIAARNVALSANRSDVLVFCDDDTVAHPDWVERILAHFQRDPTLGGLGGRDRCHDGERFDEEQKRVVGRVQWFGRTIGNHHRGYGPPREVHFLKGANMSYHAEAIEGLRFDERLRGKGAQAHDDLSFSLAVWRARWKLLYDPAVLLDHYAFKRDQPRSYVASAALADPAGYYDSCYNYALVLSEQVPGYSFMLYVLWSFFVGIRSYPGLVQLARLTLHGEKDTWRKFLLFQHALWLVCGSALSSKLSESGHRLG